MTDNPYIPFPMKVTSVVKETAIDWTFRVEADFTPIGGQFLQLSIPGVGEAPISISDFGPGWIDMTIRKVGRLTDVIFDLKPGQDIFARGPYGNGFDLNQYRGKNLFMVTGGTGLAPVKNIVTHFHNHPEEIKSFTLILGFKSPEDILFAEEIKAWSKNINVILTVDKEQEGWTGNTGLVTQYISDYDFGTEPTEVIVVGPPMMMKFSTLALVRKEIPKENIWVSFERKMSCGIGKCGHCKIDETYVCLEGPVFNYPKAQQLLD